MSIERIRRILSESNYRIKDGKVQCLSLGEWKDSAITAGRVQMRLYGQALEWFSLVDVLEAVNVNVVVGGEEKEGTVRDSSLHAGELVGIIQTMRNAGTKPDKPIPVQPFEKDVSREMKVKKLNKVIDKVEKKYRDVKSKAEDIKKLYLGGMKAADIAKKLGIARTSVINIINKIKKEGDGSN